MTTLLAADVGNTNVVLGVYDGAKLVSTWRTATRHDQTEDELAVMVDALLGREDLSLDDVDALVLGSVVPPLTASFTRLAERYLDRPALVIGPGVKTGVRLRVDNPSEVGADRIANTLAAHRRYGGPAIVVDSAEPPDSSAFHSRPRRTRSGRTPPIASARGSFSATSGWSKDCSRGSSRSSGRRDRGCSPPAALPLRSRRSRKASSASTKT